jgi:hypothetical protein
VSSTRTATTQHTPQQAPAGYKWIAVRPGSAPPQRPVRQPLGPTPRYTVTPRWGLTERFDNEELGGPESEHSSSKPVRSGPSAKAVRRVSSLTMAILGLAALVQIGSYALLLVNRTTLLNPWVAGVATWVAVAVSVLAAFAVVGSAIVLTNWLIARRAAAYADRGDEDHRSPSQVRAGCLFPVINLFWAPVYVIELAKLEGRMSRLRTGIVAWWCVWALATVVCGYSIATSFTRDAQGIADNTVVTSIAYLFGLAALLLAARVYLGFERTAVERAVKRWVLVPSDTADDAPEDARGESPVPVESGQREPAA